MKTKPASVTTPAAAVTSRRSEVAAHRETNTATSPWRPPTRRWFLGAVAVAAAAVVVAKPKPSQALPTRWIGHC